MSANFLALVGSRANQRPQKIPEAFYAENQSELRFPKVFEKSIDAFKQG